MKYLSLIIILLHLFVISCEKEMEVSKNRYGHLKGYVQNEFGQPIDGALIEIGHRSVLSGTSGSYSIEKLETKEYTVSVSKEHFLPQIQNVSIREDETATLDINLLAGEAYLTISDSALRVNAGRGAFTIEISSNADWTIEKESSWLECSSENGKGNGSVRFSYSKNEEDSDRKDTIRFISGSLKKTLILNQSMPIKLISYEGLIGNEEIGIKDSVYILFNKPVTIEVFRSNWEFCLSDMDLTRTDDNCGIRVSFPCAELGGNYPFTVSVFDDDDNSFSVEMDIPFYKSKFDFSGFMTDFLLINDEKDLLISTFSPSKLIRYSLESDSIIQTVSLSQYLSPIEMVYNPFNDKVYMMGSKPEASFRLTSMDRPDIFTFDLQTGEILKAITIESDEYDHPESPANIPYNMAFTKSGRGIILLKANGSSALRWKLIDCANNDSIYMYPFDVADLGDFTDFNNIYMNYDQTKLYLTKPYGSCDYGIFDAATQHISILEPSSRTNGHSITPHRKSDRFYARQLYDQFIMDLDGTLSQISYLDSRHHGQADFSYRKQDVDIIYLCEEDSYINFPNHFYILDYVEGQTILSCDVIEGLRKFTTTVDGNLAIAYKQNSDISSSLYIFKTETFHRTLE